MCRYLLFSTRSHFSAPSFDSCSWQTCWSSADPRMWRWHLQPPANVCVWGQWWDTGSWHRSAEFIMMLNMAPLRSAQRSLETSRCKRQVEHGLTTAPRQWLQYAAPCVCGLWPWKKLSSRLTSQTGTRASMRASCNVSYTRVCPRFSLAALNILLLYLLAVFLFIHSRDNTSPVTAGYFISFNFIYTYYSSLCWDGHLDFFDCLKRTSSVECLHRHLAAENRQTFVVFSKDKTFFFFSFSFFVYICAYFVSSNEVNMRSINQSAKTFSIKPETVTLNI